MTTDTEINWQIAQVHYDAERGTLQLRAPVRRTRAESWPPHLEEVAKHRQPGWGDITMSDRKTIGVDEVEPGCEDALREHLEYLVVEADKALQVAEDRDRERKAAASSMTRVFQQF